MKFTWDKTYLKYSLYIILTATILYILYAIISNTGLILYYFWQTLSSIFRLLSPFIIALVIAYLLHPVVNWIEKYLFSRKKRKEIFDDKKNHQLKRTLSVLLTYVLVLSLIVLFIYSTYVMIGGQISRQVNVNSMIESIAKYAERYNDIFVQAQQYLESSGLSDDIKAQFKQAMDGINNVLSSATSGAFDYIKRFGNNIVNILFGIIIGFYLLKDIDYFKKLYHDMTRLVFSKRRNEKLSKLLHDINTVVSNFIRGQLLDGLIVGILSSIGLALIGLDFAVLIGLTAGFANIIPYFGPLIGMIPAVVVGLLSGAPIKALFAVGILLLVQQLDSTIIAPKVVGESVGLHPVFVILSLIIGGTYFGLLGMLLAVPVAGIIKLLFLQWLDNYKTQQ